MGEKRRHKRVGLESSMVLKRLDGGQPAEIEIEITDCSKSGVGFVCDEPLMIGTIYESFLTIWTKETLHVFLLIVRAEKQEDTFYYGSSFIGMTEADANRILTYMTVEEHSK